MILKAGDIGFSSNNSTGLAGFVPKAIRYFTKSKWSHSLLIQAPILKEEAVQEASDLVQIVPFQRNYRDSTETFEMFRIKKGVVSKATIDASLKKCFNEFTGQKYGYLQLFWFIYRAIAEKFGKDVRHNKNWLSDGVICSELVYWYLFYLGEPFKTLLEPWNADTIQPQDIYNIVQSHPELFELVEIKA
jgi:hypothetical protein